MATSPRLGCGKGSGERTAQVFAGELRGGLHAEGVGGHIGEAFAAHGAANVGAPAAGLEIAGVKVLAGDGADAPSGTAEEDAATDADKHCSGFFVLVLVGHQGDGDGGAEADQQAFGHVVLEVLGRDSQVRRSCPAKSRLPALRIEGLGLDARIRGSAEQALRQQRGFASSLDRPARARTPGRRNGFDTFCPNVQMSKSPARADRLAPAEACGTFERRPRG